MNAVPSFAVLLVLAVPCAAADTVMLQQAARPNEAATLAVVVDRDRLASARLRQGAKPPYVVELTLATQPSTSLSIRCQDLAGARQVLDAVRTRGPAVLDVSGRCWFD